MSLDIARRPSLRLSTTGIEQILVSKIKRDGGTQSRMGIDGEHVQRLLDALEAGEQLPPIILFYDGAAYWLADGFHRCEAASMSKGIEAVLAAEVRQGDRRDAVLYSVGANRSHGLPRSRQDMRRAIETLLRDPEWGQWSDREIARQVGCHHNTVGALRSKFGSGGEISHLERRGSDGKMYAVGVKDPGIDAEMPIYEDNPKPNLILTHQGFQGWAARAAALGMKLIHNHEDRNYLLDLPDGTTMASHLHGGEDLTAYIARVEKEVEQANPVERTMMHPPSSTLKTPICTYCGTQGGTMIGKLCEATCYHITRANELGATATGRWHVEMARIGITALTNERKAARLTSDLDLLEQYWSEQYMGPEPVAEPVVEPAESFEPAEPQLTPDQLKSRVASIFSKLIERLDNDELRLLNFLVGEESYLEPDLQPDQIREDLWEEGRAIIRNMALMDLLWVAGEL
ncbi:MAG: hypothetical protein EOM24_00785 [Chloroflexia bacterium]|nr:hypothetical protein [Chloroflexia bacterium]